MRHVAHFDRVNVVAVNQRWEEVYSAGVDHSVLVWQRQQSVDEQEVEEGEPLQSSNVSALRTDTDDWSLDDA